MKVKSNGELFLIAGIFVLAGVLLFVNLGGRDYWSDEIFSLPKMRNPEVVLAQSSLDVHPPLFFLLEYYWIELFGRSETATRAMSALFGLLGIFTAYLLGKRIIPGRNLKFYLIILAASPFYLFYARMNRYYALTGLLCLLTIYLFHRMLEKRGLKREIPFWVSTLVLIYEDYIGFILLFCLGLYYIWYHRGDYKRWWRFAAGGVIILVLYLPWVNNLLYGAGKGSAPYPEAMVEREFRLVGFIVYNAVQSVVRTAYAMFDFILGETVYPWNPVILIGMAGGLILIVSAFKRKEGSGGFWFFCLFSPFVLYILAVAFYGRVFSAANFALLPSKMLFIQPLLLMFLFRGEKAGGIAIKAGFALLLLFNLISLANYHRGAQYLNPKFIVPWREIAVQFAEDDEGRDIVVTDESPLLHYLSESGVKAYGLVGADDYIDSQEAPLKVHLVLRHRGEEAIYLEGVKLKAIFDERYGQPDFRGYLPMRGLQKKFWNRIMGMDFDHYLEIFTYDIKKGGSSTR
ncbi:MAG: glycosyltransferase family 39 protein [candidate division Zixibacteria bacterium]|nr:glycosyltransferase family 39 protein [Candidatus Tariuqbacter arcticus]